MLDDQSVAIEQQFGENWLATHPAAHALIKASSPSGFDGTEMCLALRREALLREDLVDEMRTAQVDQMGALLVVRQVGAKAFDHHHDKRAIIHVEPIGPANELIFAVANERAVEIGREIGLIVTRHWLRCCLRSSQYCPDWLQLRRWWCFSAVADRLDRFNKVHAIHLGRANEGFSTASPRTGGDITVTNPILVGTGRSNVDQRQGDDQLAIEDGEGPCGKRT